MMRMEHRLAQTQAQRLMQTQKMQQAIQVLQLSGLELEQYVQQELETNPVLEELRKAGEGALETPNRDNQSGAASDGEPFDDVSWDLDAFAGKWQDFGKTAQDLSVNRDADARRDYYQNSITKDQSLISHLMQQLHLAIDDPKQVALGESIIGDIDARGYFKGSLEAIAEDAGIEVSEAEAMLERIQRFDPPGVGARDIVECLLLQIDFEMPAEEELRTMVADHLDELQRGHLPKIAKAMDVSVERVEELRGMLSRLDPWPGLEYNSEPAQYVVPDVVIERDEETGEFLVGLADGSVPALRINPDYSAMAKRKDLEKDEKSYLREKVESARWLIRNIEQRQNTILKTAKAIVEVQHAFFEKGVEAIKPLTLQEIADRVGVHEATVSRTTRGKYMQTPQGLFEMKYFFSPGLKRDDGDDQSAKSVQSLVKKLVEEEDKRKPLSDQKIADMLKKDGINIARRTVTKYREALNIPSTTLRRSYDS